MQLAPISMLLISTLIACTAATAAPRANRVAGFEITDRDATLLENRGQWRDSVRFAAVDLGYRAIIFDRGIRVWPPGVPQSAPSICLEFGGLEFSGPRGVDATAGLRHFFLDDDPSSWARDVQAFDRVALTSNDGRLSVFINCRSRKLEFDIESVDADAIRDLRIRISGAFAIETSSSSALEASIPGWRLGIHGLQTFTVGQDGVRHPTESRMAIANDGDVVFDIGPHRSGEAIVIDPGLEWATALGGVQATPMPGPFPCAEESVSHCSIAPNGDLVIFAQVCTADFPTTPGAYDESYNGGFHDVVVTRLSESGSALIWSTYIGGSKSGESVDDGVVLSNGRVVFAARRSDSQSVDQFPTTPGVLFPTDPTIDGSCGILCCLEADGASIVYSTYFSTAANSQITSLSCIDENAVWIGGAQLGSQLPTTPDAFQTASSPALQNWMNVGFLARIDAAATQLGYSTFIGGSDSTAVLAIQAVNERRVIIAGATNATDYPVTPGAFASSGGNDGVVSILEPGQPTFAASTYLGGAGQNDYVTCATLDSLGYVYISGETNSIAFPTTPGALMPSPFGLANGFLAKLSPDLRALEYATYLTGLGSTTPNSLHVDPSGAATIVGNTNAFSLPTTPGAYKTEKSGTSGKIDGFAMRFSPDAKFLYYSTYFGGTLNDAQILQGPAPVGAVDPVGSLYVAGETISTDFGFTPGSYDPFLPIGEMDLFAAKLNMSPKGTTKLGAPTPGCLGSPYVEALEMPVAGDFDFRFRCVRGPKQSPGFLLASPSARATPLVLSCLEIWPAAAGAVVAPIVTDALGTVNLTATIRSHFAQQTAVIQFVFADACSPCGLASSNALMIEVQ